MRVKQLSMGAPRKAAEKKFSVSTSAATSNALDPGDYLFVSDTAVNMVCGANPTADNTYPLIPANTLVRIAGVQDQEKISVIGAATGTAYLWKDRG